MTPLPLINSGLFNWIKNCKQNWSFVSIVEFHNEQFPLKHSRYKVILVSIYFMWKFASCFMFYVLYCWKWSYALELFRFCSILAVKRNRRKKFDCICKIITFAMETRDIEVYGSYLKFHKELKKILLSE